MGTLISTTADNKNQLEDKNKKIKKIKSDGTK